MDCEEGSAGSTPTAIGPTWVAHCYICQLLLPKEPQELTCKAAAITTAKIVELPLTTPQQPKREVGHVAQEAAEEKAAASAKEGLARRAREAEATAQALAENVEELRLTLDRQRASAELR